MISDHNEGTGLATGIIFAIIIPIGILLAVFAHIADFLTTHFVLTSVLYFIFSVVASVVLPRFKGIASPHFMEYISNFLMFVLFYIYIYFYFVPQFFIRGVVIAWILGFAFISVIVFLQQCLSRVFSPILNLIIYSVIFVVTFIILRGSISSHFSLDELAGLYRRSESGVFRGVIGFLFF